MKLFIILITIFAISCKSHNNLEPQKAQELPKALTDESSDVSSFSLRKSNDDNLIEQMFAELMEKDKSLTMLIDSIVNLKKMKTDSLSGIVGFINKNNSFYQLASNMSDEIHDSTLHSAIQKIVDNSKSKFKNKTANLKEQIKSINKQDSLLNDFMIALKISKTIKIIESYQDISKQKTVTLKKINSEYRKTINKAKEKIN